MKGVIVEKRNGRVVILTDDGRFIHQKDRGYEIGRIVNVNKKMTLTAAAVAAAACFGIFMGGVWGYNTESTYVSLDVNPSIEFSVNAVNRVIGINGVNDDGQELLEAVNLRSFRNQKIEDAVASTIELLKDKGYIVEEGGIMISTSAKNPDKSEKLAEELKKKVEEQIPDTSTTVEAVSIAKERVEEAHALGVTPGKLLLVEKLAEYDEDIDIEQWLDHSVKDIMKQRKTYRAELCDDCNKLEKDCICICDDCGKMEKDCICICDDCGKMEKDCQCDDDDKDICDDCGKLEKVCKCDDDDKDICDDCGKLEKVCKCDDDDKDICDDCGKLEKVCKCDDDDKDICDDCGKLEKVCKCDDDDKDICDDCGKLEKVCKCDDDDKDICDDCGKLEKNCTCDDDKNSNKPNNSKPNNGKPNNDKGNKDDKDDDSDDDNDDDEDDD